MRPIRQTVDLTQYPDLVVIYLGMRVKSFRGFKTLMGLGPEIQKSVKAKPDGLLLHEDVVYGLLPPHFGMRQYWRDFESLEKWTRELPHLKWWKDFNKDPGGVGFWHETYFLRGGFEVLYGNMTEAPTGLQKAMPPIEARGSMFSARRRLGLPGSEPSHPTPESDLYRD
jgi:hypothetical protein